MSVFGVWMWPQSVRRDGAPCVAARCAQAGITDIFFLVKGLSGTTAHKSSLAPMICKRDLLQELLDSAHPLGIRVHAWMTSASDEQYKALHPESGRCHYTRGKDKGLIALTDKPYIAYMQRITAELCAGYDIDGLHLDYIRYNHLLYGWSKEDRQRYQAAGASIAHLEQFMNATFSDKTNEDCIFYAFRDGEKSVHALAQVRRQDVCAFAKALTDAARAEKSSLLLSAALMPEGALSDTAFSDLHYGQSYADAAQLYDLVLPMAYSKAYDRSSEWVRAVALGSLEKGLKTVVGLHAYQGGSGPSLRADIDVLGDTAVSGICLFREGAHALGFAEGKNVRIYNALDQPIIALSASKNESPFALENALAPGEERTIAFPHAPDILRVFTREGEACIYLAAQR